MCVCVSFSLSPSISARDREKRDRWERCVRERRAITSQRRFSDSVASTAAAQSKDEITRKEIVIITTVSARRRNDNAQPLKFLRAVHREFSERYMFEYIDIRVYVYSCVSVYTISRCSFVA